MIQRILVFLFVKLEQIYMLNDRNLISIDAYIKLYETTSAFCSTLKVLPTSDLHATSKICWQLIYLMMSCPRAGRGKVLARHQKKYKRVQIG